MTKGTLIRRLKALSLLGPCVRYGLISPQVYRNLEIQDRVNSLMRSGMNKNGAVVQVGAEKNLDRANVYRILRDLT